MRSLPEAAGGHASFEDVGIEYLEYARPRRAPSSLTVEQIHLRHFERFLGERARLPISNLTTADVERYLTERRRKVTGTTANKELQTLRQLLDFARKRGDIEHNPTYEATRFKGAGRPHRFLTKAEIDGELQRGGLSEEELKALRRFRYLNKEEIVGLLDLAQERTPWLYPILATMAFTGVRRGEAVALEWGEVDFEGGRIWVRSRKQSRKQEFTARDIGLHDKLRDVLLRHREHGPKGRYVFRGRDGGPLTPYELHEAFKKLIRGSDYEGIGLHCLRHSFASNLAAQGVDGRLIDHYMGHQTEAMRHRYQHLFPEKKSEGIQRLPY
jgi:integrase